VNLGEVTDFVSPDCTYAEATARYRSQPAIVGQVLGRKKCFARPACVLNLRFDGLPIYGENPGRKFYTDGRLGVDIESATSGPHRWAEVAYNVRNLRSPRLRTLLSTGPPPCQYGRTRFRREGYVSKPGSPMRTVCQGFWFSGLFPRFLAGEKDLGEEIGITVGHGGLVVAPDYVFDILGFSH
jgi:hypothetical protein